MALGWLEAQTDLDKAKREAKVCREIADYYLSNGILKLEVYKIVMRDIDVVIKRLEDEQRPF